MTAWLKIAFSKNRIALINAWYLSILQFLSLIFPLITYPYILKVIGAELYGSVLLGQGTAYFLSAFVSYGFNLSTTREISLNKHNHSFVSKVYTATMVCKLLVFIPATIIFYTYGYITALPEQRELFLLCIGPLVYELLFPTWLFLGLEKMKYITIVSVTSRFILLVSVFLFIQEKSDATLLALINLSFYIGSGLFSQYIAFRHLAIRLVKIRASFCISLFKDSYAIFISSIFIAMKDRLNIIVVGNIFGAQHVVIYDLAMKILSVISIPQNIIFSAFYPSVVKEKNINKIKRLGALITAINIVIIVAMFIVLPYAFRYLIGGNHHDIYNVYILSSTLVLTGVSGVLGRFVMLTFGYDRLLANTTIANCIFYFISILAYYFFCDEKSLIDFSILIFIIYSSELLIRFIGLKISGFHYAAK